MKEFMQIRGFLIAWFISAIANYFTYMIIENNSIIIIFRVTSISIFVIDLLLYLIVLQRTKSISSTYLVLFCALLLPHLITILILFKIVNYWDDPRRKVVALLILTIILIDMVSRFVYQREKLRKDLFTHPMSFGVIFGQMLATPDLVLPSDTEKWFRS